MTTKATGPFTGLTNSINSRKVAKRIKKKTNKVRSVTVSEAPTKLMKVSHAMTLIYIALLLAFSIVAVQNNRIRKTHSELLAAHDALYLETQVMRLEASAITSPNAIRPWAKNQGMVPHYSSVMELEQLEPSSIQLNRELDNSNTGTSESEGQ